MCAKLRRSNIDGAAGAREEVERIVAQIRQRWARGEDYSARRLAGLKIKPSSAVFFG